MGDDSVCVVLVGGDLPPVLGQCDYTLVLSPGERQVFGETHW